MSRVRRVERSRRRIEVKTEIDTPVLARVRTLVTPIVTDLGLEIYDLELRGGVLRLTLDTPAGADGGVTLDLLALGSRLVSKELDAHDPIPSRYTLEVTSPGVERSLRTPAHFQREVGKDVALRLHHVESDQRRVKGRIVAADDDGVTVRVDGENTTIAYAQIDRARTVFEWGPQPKPGSAAARRQAEADAGADLDGDTNDDRHDAASADHDSDETETT
jgi:ribosome maturation factor RimP